ncbi:hypothetical protein ABB37_10077 [Leptomonas pyrrhocoris]|uniref:Uncharacterized protein n=1 Tax=Leptomonas pyrrhocoris TaxID=157538 RepID=A0A0M9FP68_LEPPY|nr:hypothetical protein ABB37_10077 [Leptomonas pyrrhocoris]XP_015651616.1 hypothetical protein ABB37_10077 [Leptomonas pyrrhocoris]KPA73176.1 hypothetical protein ABB37_10077 [Leptomonas pyrrhocoris]KPA73177.1 hypothetical protein ABB37_10077 [Leptomonas pyrrhocoris]|eukprot:XP_015651615.1 hypothetical protein ABB37_10077 [Leptomonas pyrrhocoris]
MPDFSQFIKYLNANLSAPTFQSVAQTSVGGKGVSSPNGTTENFSGAAHSDTSAFLRSCDTTWRMLLPSDAAAKESNARSSAAAATAAAHQTPSHPTVTVGRMMVSTEDRWRIQVQMRREEARSGQARKEYNKKVTRAIKVTKGPSDNAFPPGRGRPL